MDSGRASARADAKRPAVRRRERLPLRVVPVGGHLERVLRGRPPADAPAAGSAECPASRGPDRRTACSACARRSRSRPAPEGTGSAHPVRARPAGARSRARRDCPSARRIRCRDASVFSGSTSPAGYTAVTVVVGRLASAVRRTTLDTTASCRGRGRRAGSKRDEIRAARIERKERRERQPGIGDGVASLHGRQRVGRGRRRRSPSTATANRRRQAAHARLDNSAGRQPGDLDVRRLSAVRGCRTIEGAAAGGAVASRPRDGRRPPRRTTRRGNGTTQNLVIWSSIDSLICSIDESMTR